jgi:hypothetical protein
MAPHEFFTTLTKFTQVQLFFIFCDHVPYTSSLGIQEFIVTREKVERIRKLEAKDAAAKEAMAAGRSRRASNIETAAAAAQEAADGKDPAVDGRVAPRRIGIKSEMSRRSSSAV